MPSQRTLSGDEKEVLKGAMTCARDLMRVGPFYCQFTAGIISLIASHANKIGSKEDLKKIIPYLEEKWCTVVMNIFWDFFPETVTRSQ